MPTHVESLTIGALEGAWRAARVVDHPVTLVVDATQQRAIVLPSGRVTVRADR